MKVKADKSLCTTNKSKGEEKSAFEELGAIAENEMEKEEQTNKNRYPKRAVTTGRCYKEAEVPDDDHYLCE